MPFKAQIRDEAGKVINAIGVITFPLLMSFSLPVFLYTIVLEKVWRLMQNMKINGLKMNSYWIVSFIFNYGLYIISMMSYLMYGKYVSGLQFFEDGNFLVILHTFLAWGLNQVSLAFVLSCFLSDS